MTDFKHFQGFLMHAMNPECSKHILTQGLICCRKCNCGWD